MPHDPYAYIRPLYTLKMSLLEDILSRCPEYVMDIGANVGGLSSTMASRCGYIDAFEPVPDCFAKLKEWEQKFPNIHAHQLAMSDKEGMIPEANVFRTWTILPNAADIHSLGTLGMGRARDYPEESHFEMKITTVDHWIDEHGKSPDFIKLDVDGYEFRVLRGAEKTLRSKPCPILFEYSFLPKLLEDSIKEMAEFIYALGYRAWSGDGSFYAGDSKEFLKYYPHDTSYDVMLVHSSQR